MSLADWYARNHGPTPMTQAFLSGENLLRVQAMLTSVVRADTGLRPAAPQPFTEQLLSELMYWAKQYDTAEPSPDALDRLNRLFVEAHRDGLVWNRNNQNFWQRWQADGIPDPLNMPYATQPDREERNADQSAYLLRHPWGQLLPRY